MTSPQVKQDPTYLLGISSRTETNTCSKAAKITCIALAIIVFLASALLTVYLFQDYGARSYSVFCGGILLSAALSFLSLKFHCQTRTLTWRLDKAIPITGEGTFAERRAASVGGILTDTCMSQLSVIEGNPERVAAKAKVVEFLNNPGSDTMTPYEQRAMGILLGMACGDAIGAPFEFLPFKPEGYQKSGQKVSMSPAGFTGMTQIHNRFHLAPGQWTDDTSMGLCVADSLLEEESYLNNRQLMQAFKDWWDHGYNNAFTKGEPHRSIGLGGNIRMALEAFNEERHSTETDYSTQTGDKYTSGNGSLMRLGAVVIGHINFDIAQERAREQSKVTHRGDEAAGCCELMAYLLVIALELEEEDPKNRKDALFASLSAYKGEVESVSSLSDSLPRVCNAQDPSKVENWNWKDDNFTFNRERLEAQPGYIGSYAMDALAMALHCVYTTDTFEEAVLKAATRGGDADTVGAITGQLAGALYGVRAIPKSWLDAVHQWDRGGEIATRAYLLAQSD